MFLARIGVWQFVAALALSVGIVPAALAAGWFDDFNDGSVTDGNPVTWIENAGGSPYFPGIYDASSGDYLLNPDDDSLTGQSVTWVDGFNFNDTYVRTQGIVMPDPNDPVNNTGGNLVVLGRINPTSLEGYLAYVDVSGNLNIQISFGLGGTLDIGTTFDLPFNAGSEIILELNIVGDQLSAFAWQPGQPKPESPQAFATDSTFTSAGMAGLAYSPDDPNTFGIYRFAAAQDVPFVDPPLELPGDYNEDGTVNAADYPVWRDGGSPDDTQAGYDLWKANFGNTTEELGSGSAAVPEPTSLVCVFMALAAVAGFYRSRNLR
ncbi:MAG: hypothetical protein WD851_01225 [Pirellulales bacterium]